MLCPVCGKRFELVHSNVTEQSPDETEDGSKDEP
jgi:hypothetical protein